MNLILFAVVVAIASVSAAPSLEVENQWQAFKVKHGKQYSSTLEEADRKAIFTDNLKAVIEHNQRFADGLETFTMAINKFADMTSQEFNKKMNGYKKSKDVPRIDIVKFQPDSSANIPDSFDWRDHGAVTPVKNQASCGSCWSFSTTGSLEGQYFLKTGKLVSMSEQNLVDCSTNGGNSGCNGGDMIPALTYVHTNDGIDSEESYPYQGVDRRCRYTEENNVTSDKGYGYIESGNEEQLKEAVATIGPIAVAFDASHMNFQLYEDGIYSNILCTNKADELDHAILAVGYGSEDGKDYWLLKNSWDTDWGINGYFKSLRNKNDACGVAAEGVYPLMY